MIVQLVRERPPGYGGVERVAHELAAEWSRQGIPVSTVCLQTGPAGTADPLPVPYERVFLPRLSFGQLLFPLPSRKLLSILNQTEILHVHLPCPGLLALSILARLRHPRRVICLHWHAFLQPPAGPRGWPIQIYQWVAIRWAAVGVQRVITTSPVLASALKEQGVRTRRIRVLPCCLGEEQERSALEASAVTSQLDTPQSPLRVVFIGRLDSYKRVDWLIEAFAASRAGRLDVVGDGPLRHHFQELASSSGRGEAIHFHGRLDEQSKLKILRQSQLLVLPADRSNEAFGIVQLEAMACGVPSLALECPRSGAAWVGQLKKQLGLPKLVRSELTCVINRLVEDPGMLAKLSGAARERYRTTFARPIWQARLANVMQ